MENLNYTKYFIPNLDLDEYMLPMTEVNSACGLFIRITDKCNKNCSFCINSHLKTGKNMSIENFENVCRYYSNFSKSINIYGGEPTIHPDFDKILFIAQNCYKEVIVLTNGSNIKKLKSLRTSDKVIFNGKYTPEINLDDLPTKPNVTISYIFTEYNIDISVFKEIMKRNNKLFLILATNVRDFILKDKNRIEETAELAYILGKTGLHFSFNSSYPLCVYRFIPLTLYKKYTEKVPERNIFSQINIGPDLKIVNFNFPTELYFNTKDVFATKKLLFDYNISKIHLIEKELLCAKCKYLYKYYYKNIFHLLQEMSFIKGSENVFSINAE